MTISQTKPENVIIRVYKFHEAGDAVGMLLLTKACATRAPTKLQSITPLPIPNGEQSQAVFDPRPTASVFPLGLIKAKFSISFDL